MRIHGSRVAGFLIVAAGLLLLGSVQSVQTEQAGGRVEIDGDDIGGVVTGPDGPEAGVWVIAETTDLPTKFSRSVVTDDQGRYVIPDLPDANYRVWVRGYGLVDSPRQAAMPGQSLDLGAVPAPSEAAAAEYYPAAYWLALMDRPIAGCGLACHQIGNKATREIPVSIREKTATSLEAWDMRVAAGPEGASMAAAWRGLGDDREAFAEWTDRVAAGELPPDKPARPVGVERNLVVTVYDWGTKFDGRTDAVAADLRDGAVNPHGPVYMVSRSNDILTMLDPVENSSRNLIVPSESPVTRDNTPWSPYWGDEPVWKRQSEPRSLAMDSGGRAWLSAIVREAPRQNPEFCTSPENRYAEHFPLTSRSRRALPRQASLYEPETGEFTSIGDVCTSLDHNQFGPDDYMYFGSRDVVFWIDTPTFLETRNTEESVGWCPAVVDTNGDGEITQGWTEPDEPIDPTRDHRVDLGCYQIAVDLNDPDGVAWCGDADGSWTLQTTRGPPHAPREGSGSAQHVPRGSVHAAGRPGHLRRSARRRRQRRGRLDELARQPALHVVRLPQVRGDARAGGRHRRALQGRLDGVPEGRPEPHRHECRGGQHLPAAGRSAQRARARGGYPDVRHDELRRAAGAAARDGRVHPVARTVSDGFLLALGQRARRRRNHRLEGQEPLVELLDLHALARGGRVQRRRRYRERVEGGQVPDAPAPARTLVEEASCAHWR